MAIVRFSAHERKKSRIKGKYKEPRTTVHYWDKDGKEGQYSFKGSPDLDRIYRETIGEGQLAVWVNVGRYVDVFVKPITSIQFSSSEWYEKTWRRDEVYRELGAAVKDYVKKKKQIVWDERDCFHLVHMP